VEEGSGWRRRRGERGVKDPTIIINFYRHFRNIFTNISTVNFTEILASKYQVFHSLYCSLNYNKEYSGESVCVCWGGGGWGGASTSTQD